MMKDFMIKNDIILNKEIDDNMFICYFIMNNLFTGNEYIYLNINILCYEIYGDMDVDKRKRNNISNAINKLIDMKIINVISSNGKTNNCTYVIYANDLSIKNCENGFTKITKEEFDKCKDNFSMFRYFCVMMSTVNNDKNNKNYKTWFNISSLLEKCNISARTQYRYNEELEKRQVIHIYKSKLITRTVCGYKQLADVYGRFEDKITIDKVGIYNDGIYGYECNGNKKLESNRRRSIKHYYNSFINGTYKRDLNELIEMCKEYNEHSNDKLDMNVFNNIIQEDVNWEEVLDEIDM